VKNKSYESDEEEDGGCGLGITIPEDDNVKDSCGPEKDVDQSLQPLSPQTRDTFLDQ